ncbi:addiction module toxin RelE [Sinorhizobium medicae]|uniref:addiction module toxin RelE n=1 Tax=Sinorhizobium medicae TaxID=110321 RepID=UPI001F371357|nr:addiction module toxin RelE [Sinorhizobium medicae]
MQTVAETPLFIKQAAELFTEEERRELIDFLAANPQAGDEIPGAGGVRKLRFAAKGKGKRGGARVIYYWSAMRRRFMPFWRMERTRRPI